MNHSDLLDHIAPWTEQDFALPDDHRRIELLDGGLLVSPAAGGRHQRLSSQLRRALGWQHRTGWRCWEPSTSGWRPAGS